MSPTIARSLNAKDLKAMAWRSSKSKSGNSLKVRILKLDITLNLPDNQ